MAYTVAIRKKMHARTKEPQFIAQFTEQQVLVSDI
jgi:hypothetical protein